LSLLFEGPPGRVSEKSLEKVLEHVIPKRIGLLAFRWLLATDDLCRADVDHRGFQILRQLDEIRRSGPGFGMNGGKEWNAGGQ